MLATPCCCLPCFLHCPASACPLCCAAMDSLRVLAFDHEGRPIEFDKWLDDLQLYLLSDSRDTVLLFDHTSGAAPAPPATADSVTRSQWLTRDAAARLAIRNHLPLAECAHFGQHRTAQAVYDDIVARYSSPATAALGRLLLPYLFPELSAFATLEDLVTHLRSSDARYHAALPAEFLDRNPPPMYITLYFIVIRLPDSLRSVKDHFLALDPIDLTVDLLEQQLLAAETIVDVVGATRGTPRRPFFEGCPPSPLAPSYASSAAVDVLGAEDVGAASASAKHRSRRAKVAGVVAVAVGLVVGAAVEVVEAVEVVAVVGVVSGMGAFVESVVAAVGVAVVAAVGVVAVGLELLSVECGASGGSGSCPFVICTSDRAGQTCGKPHTQHRCFSRLDDAWRAEFGDEAERPHWAELLRSGVAILDLDYDVIFAAMYALSVSAKGDSYMCVSPDPGIDAAALGASESVLLGTAPAEALHTFTVDSGASRCFFRNSTTLTPLSAPVPVRLADPSRGPVLASSSTVLPCPAAPSGSPSGLHLPSFSRNLRIAPHSSSFPPTTASLQTLHMDVWGPARVSGQGRERYFLLFVDDYTRYTMVFPLRSNGEVLDVLIPWIHAVCLQLRERFREDLPVLHLHSNRGGEFSSDLLRDFCHGKGIIQSFTLPSSPQKNGIAER
ncbi:unnamed protein product [Closterium sp. NIES-53]